MIWAFGQLHSRLIFLSYEKYFSSQFSFAILILLRDFVNKRSLIWWGLNVIFFRFFRHSSYSGIDTYVCNLTSLTFNCYWTHSLAIFHSSNMLSLSLCLWHLCFRDNWIWIFRSFWWCCRHLQWFECGLVCQSSPCGLQRSRRCPC